MYGIIGVPWTHPPSRSASAVSIRFWSRKLASKSLRPLPIRLNGAGSFGSTQPPRTRLMPPIGWYGIGSTSPAFDANHAAHSSAPRGRNRCQSSTNNGAIGSESRINSPLMYWRVTSTIGRKHVVPGTFENWPFQAM